MEPTPNPTAQTNSTAPAADYLRVVVQFPCGCDAYTDVPVEMLVNVSKHFVKAGFEGYNPDDAVGYVFGHYGGQLFLNLSAVQHGPDICPATFASLIRPEEQHG